MRAVSWMRVRMQERGEATQLLCLWACRELVWKHGALDEMPASERKERGMNSFFMQRFFMQASSMRTHSHASISQFCKLTASNLKGVCNGLVPISWTRECLGHVPAGIWALLPQGQRQVASARVMPCTCMLLPCTRQLLVLEPLNFLFTQCLAPLLKAPRTLHYPHPTPHPNLVLQPVVPVAEGLHCELHYRDLPLTPAQLAGWSGTDTAA